MDYLLSYYKILDENEKEEEYTYKKSRQKFRNTAKKCNADIIDKLIVDEEDDLTIDIAVFKGNPKQLVLHIFFGSTQTDLCLSTIPLIRGEIHFFS